jgi:hypothetical protein
MKIYLRCQNKGPIKEINEKGMETLLSRTPEIRTNICTSASDILKKFQEEYKTEMGNSEQAQKVELNWDTKLDGLDKLREQILIVQAIQKAIQEVIPSPSIQEVIPSPSIQEVIPSPSIQEVIPSQSQKKTLENVSDKMTKVESKDQKIERLSLEDISCSEDLKEAFENFSKEFYTYVSGREPSEGSYFAQYQSSDEADDLNKPQKYQAYFTNEHLFNFKELKQKPDNEQLFKNIFIDYLAFSDLKTRLDFTESGF